MTPAVVALAIALAVAVPGLITLAVLAITAERGRGGEKSGRAELAVRLEVAIANKHTESARADAEKERADALDDLLAEHLADGPVDGAWERLQAKWRAARAGAAGRRGSPVVSDEDADGEPADGPGPDDLMRPEE